MVGVAAVHVNSGVRGPRLETHHAGFLSGFLNPIPPGLFVGDAAWGGRKCPRPITLKLLMIMK